MRTSDLISRETVEHYFPHLSRSHIPSTATAFCLGSPNLCSSDFLPQPQCYPDFSLSFLCIPLLSIYPYWIAVPASLFRHCILPFPPVLNSFCLISSQFVHSSQYWPLWPVSATLHSWPKLLFTLSQSLWPNGKHRSPPAHKGFRLLGLCFRDEYSQCKHNLCFWAKFLNHGTTYKLRKSCRLQLGQLWVDFHRSGKRRISSTKVGLYQISKYALKNWQGNIYITGQHFLLIQAN